MEDKKELLKRKNRLIKHVRRFTDSIDVKYLNRFIHSISDTVQEAKTLSDRLEAPDINLTEFYEALFKIRNEKIHDIDSLLEEYDIVQADLDKYLFENKLSIEPSIDSNGVLHCFTEEGKGVKLTMKSRIGSGGYGDVQLYSSRSGNIKYAVKFAIIIDGELNDGNERKAVLELKEQEILRNKKSNILNAKTIQCIDQFAVLMPLMDGTFEDLDMKGWRIDHKKIVLDSIRSQMEYIIRLNDADVIMAQKQDNFKFAYTDLKPSNIFYKNDPKFTVKLGDLGGILPIQGNIFISTIPVQFKEPDTKNSHKDIFTRLPDKNIVKCMRYVFGLISYWVLTNDFQKLESFFEIVGAEDLIACNDELVINFGIEFANLIYDEKTHRTSMYN